jgi:DNA-binding HxlR family transcriptional regulator
MDAKPQLCLRFQRAIELIGRRWTGAIVFVLLQRGARFATLRSAIPEMTDRMLSERLRELEREGIVERREMAGPGVRVKYELTQRGRALAEAVTAIAEWSHAWLDASGECPSECPDCVPEAAEQEAAR